MLFAFRGKSAICILPTCIHWAVIFPAAPTPGIGSAVIFQVRAKRLEKDLWFEIHAVVFVQMLMIFGTAPTTLALLMNRLCETETFSLFLRILKHNAYIL